MKTLSDRRSNDVQTDPAHPAAGEDAFGTFGCAQAVINSMLGRQSYVCCCVIKPIPAGSAAQSGEAASKSCGPTCCQQLSSILS